jgi:hypothetical protein
MVAVVYIAGMWHRPLGRFAFVALVAACSSGARRGAEACPVSPAAELLPILRQWSGDVPPVASPWSAIADDAGDWRALRQRLGPAADGLGRDFAPPPGTRVLVLVAPGGSHTAVAEVRIATEEGVDVLTFATVAGGELRSPAWVLSVPSRRQQLAVVLALPAPGFAVPIETLLQVFEPR